MYISVNDGQVEFATHLIRAALPDDMQLPFQKETAGLVIYYCWELKQAERLLREANISYSIEVIERDPVRESKASGVKYGSRSEAIEHLTTDKAPINAMSSAAELEELRNRVIMLEQKLLAKEERLAADKAVS